MAMVTRLQNKLYAYIIAYTKDHNYPPLMREINMCFYPHNVQDIKLALYAMEEVGLIEIEKTAPHRIKLLGYTVIANETLVRLYEEYARGDGE